jgi:hypothetical protein
LPALKNPLATQQPKGAERYVEHFTEESLRR